MMLDQNFDQKTCESCLENISVVCDNCRLCLEHCCACSIDIDPVDTMAG